MALLDDFFRAVFFVEVLFFVEAVFFVEAAFFLEEVCLAAVFFEARAAFEDPARRAF